MSSVILFFLAFDCQGIAVMKNVINTRAWVTNIY